MRNVTPISIDGQIRRHSCLCELNESNTKLAKDNYHKLCLLLRGSFLILLECILVCICSGFIDELEKMTKTAV